MYIGVTRGYLLPMEQHTTCAMMTLRAPFSSEAGTGEGGSTGCSFALDLKLLRLLIKFV